jgi:hypothetical protein
MGERKRSMNQTALAVLLTVSALTVGFARAQEMPRDYAAVLSTLDKKGDYKGNVLRVNVPRNDLAVTIEGRAVPTPFGFGGWLALTKGERGLDVMMGDLVLLQEEVNPVMSALLNNGLEVSALHNHFFYEEPRIFYMHVHGHEKAEELARKVKPALNLIGKVAPRSASVPRPRVGTASAEGIFDTARLDQIVGAKGDQNGPVYKYTLGRDDLKVKEMGATINSRMGLNTWAAFFGTNEDSVVAGDVAMLEGEVQPVLKALRSNGLEVVAIHHHMTGTRPVIIFLHYWGRGPAEKLARGFRAAVDQLGKKQRMRMEH